jgi:hypothetical protein
MMSQDALNMKMATEPIGSVLAGAVVDDTSEPLKDCIR